MKNALGFIAIMGILLAMSGVVTETTAVITVICGFSYLFYPPEND